jgi:hypothetical protein
MRQLKITKNITTRESESLNRYLQEISKIDLSPKKKKHNSPKESNKEINKRWKSLPRPTLGLSFLWQNNTRINDFLSPISSTKGIFDSSKQQKGLTKPEDSNLSHMRFGGSDKAFYLPWPKPEKR